MKLNIKTDAPILIVLGQSNAHGHGTHLPEDEKIINPLKNVYGLSCEKNQAYGLSRVTWSNFVSYGMNLGETQDNTCCLANYFAAGWQAMVDNDESLPDLHIIQISVGGQGIAEIEDGGINMWYPRRKPVMKKGVLGEINISLYPLALEIFALAMKDLRQRYKNPQIIGLHWNQWETEAQTDGASISEAEKNYTELFEGFHKAIGQDFPLYLYRPLSEVYNNPTGVETLDRLFAKFVKENENVHMIDVSMSEMFKAKRKDKGIFQSDLVHYSPEVHRWFSDYQFKQIIG